VWWLLLVIAGLVVFVAVRARFWPYGPCKSCRRRRGRGVGSTTDAYNRCRRCGGKGERIRPLARMWPRWREEAKKLRGRHVV